MSALLTPYAVLSFPNLFTPKPRSEGGEPVYSAALLFDVTAQQSKEYKAMQTACIDAAKAKWGANVKVDQVAMPFRDAAEKADKYAGYEEGVMFINPWTKQKPGIVDARLQDVLTPEEVYAGQIVRAQVSPFAWQNSGKKGVSFGLHHIQIVKHDAPRIDGRVAASKAFTAIDDIDADEIPF
jgi:Enterobacter phage Enc34, ssDNA-binding protein